MKILLIENDPDIVRSLSLLFISENIEYKAVEFGIKGLEECKLCSQHYDMIILDLTLPDINGLEVLSKLRAARIKIPVLMLTESNDISCKIRGLVLGADDCMIKPFHRGELIMRIYAILRRFKAKAKILQFGNLVLNLDACTVKVNDVLIRLTDKEYNLLELLAKNSGSVVAKEVILNNLYGSADSIDHTIVNVFICKLRQKLCSASGGENYISTDKSGGYLFREPTVEFAE